MLHNIATSKVASSLRCESVTLRILSVIALFVLVVWMPNGVAAQCVTEGLAIGGAATHVELDGSWAVRGTGSSVELLKEEAGSWVSSQTIDLAGATLTSLALQSEVLAIGTSGQVQVYSHDGLTFVLEASLSEAGAGLTYGSTVAISADTLAVGSPGDDTVYFYTRLFTGGGSVVWVSSTTITGDPGDGLGTDITMAGDHTSATAPGANEIRTYIFSGVQQNLWSLEAALAYDSLAGSRMAMDLSGGELRLIAPTSTGAEVYLMGAGVWAVEAALTYTPAADPVQAISADKALVTTDCGLRLYSRTATTWNNGVALETFDAAVACVAIPAASTSESLDFEGNRAVVSDGSTVWLLDESSYVDCNGNGTPDHCDIAIGFPDCNGNGIPDSCDFSLGDVDCNNNGIIDSCEISSGLAADCNGNEVPDPCDELAGIAFDTLPPVITNLPGPVTVQLASGECQGVATWNEPTATDVCSDLTLTSDIESGTTFAVGSTTVTYTALDAEGNQAQASFEVIVSEPDAPSFTFVPESLFESADPLTCTAEITWAEPVAIDANNCSGVVITSSVPQGEPFEIGTSAIIFTATDVSGNTAVAFLNVTVADNSPPVIEQLPTLVLAAAPNTCDAVATWIPPTVSDCNEFTMTSDASDPPIQVAGGGRVVNFLAVDSLGQESTMSFDILVIDNTPPIILNMPLDMTLNPESGTCGTTILWDIPTVIDNCATEIEVMSNFEPPSTFGVGTTVVTYSATDFVGNTSSESFSVTIIDPDDPQFISTPGALLVGTADDQCGSIVEWVEPQAIDCSSLVIVTSTHQPGDFFLIGTTEVTYTATDVAGKSTDLIFPVTVEDAFAPTFVSAPADILIAALAGECSAEASWDEPVVSDGCSLFTVTSSHVSATVFPAGITPVTYTATDDLGNIREHVFFVTVNDGEGPTFDTQLPDISAPSNLGICGAQIFWTEPVAVDNCTAATVSSSHDPGAFFDVGITTVSYTALDGSGVMAQQSFTVTISDVEAPDLLQMPADIVVGNIEGTCAATVIWSAPLALDHCDEVTAVGSSAPGSSFPLGETVVTYTSSDSQGNEIQVSFTVTVEDQEAPFFTTTLPAVTLDIEPGLCTAVLEWTEPTAEDLCGEIQMDSNFASGTAFGIGVTTVLYTATDESGNTADMSFDVTVLDVESPVLVGLPDSFTAGTNPGDCTASVSWIEPAALDCNLQSLSPSLENGSVFSLGDTVVTYTAVDTAGNESLGSFTVTIIDDDAPEFTSVPADVVIDNELGTCSGAATWTDIDAQDNCSVPQIVLSHTSGDTFDLGVTSIEATATDPAGNISTLTFTVTVLDAEAPIVVTTQGSPITVENPGGACEVAATWTAPTFSDLCTAELEISSTHLPGDLFPVGETQVTYTATDGDQNQVSTSFSIVVLDSTAPTIVQIPQIVEVSTPSDACEAMVSWTEPSTFDCSLVTATSDILNGSILPIGNHIATYTFTDDSGNSISDSFLIAVADGELPQIHGVPADITVENRTGGCGVAVVWSTVTTTDCTFSALDVDHPSGSEFSIGTTLVTYTATDTEGNQATASFLVTVEDVEAPVLTNLPADIEVMAAVGSCEATASWLEPSATDCISYELSSDWPSGASFPIGQTLVTYTAIDPSGNSGTGTFTVTVLDQESPLISQMPDPIEVDSLPGTCHGVASWSEPLASDCSGAVSLIPSLPSGSEFPIGTTTVVYTASDASGNLSTASFTVTVLDTGDPIILGLPENLTFDNIEGNCAGIATWDPPTVEDCSETTLTPDFSSGSVFALGTHLVTYTAVDTAGNSAEASFEVTVVDAEAPFYLNLQSEMSFFTTPGQCDGVATWELPEAADLCGGATSTSSHESGAVFPIGTSEVIHTATDDAENEAIYITQIIVLDGEAPVISNMPLDITLEAPLGSCSVSVTWDAPTTEDCTEVTLTSSIASGSEIQIGIHVVVYTAIDAQGNIAESFFTVTILDIEEPQISQMPVDIVVTNDAAVCGAVVSWIEPLISDCSDLVSATVSLANGSFFDVGDSLVTYTAIDIYGNETSASFNINVVDKDGPVISGLPVKIEIPNYPGQCGASAFWSDPVVTDNCEIETIQSNIPPGSFFPIGENTVTYIAVDVNDNASTHDLLIIVSDTESPQIVNLPSPIFLTPDSVTCTAVADWLEPDFIDNCPGGSIATSMASGSTFPVGSTDVMVTATDEAGNTTTESFTVTVESCETSFLRGDTNDDGSFDISDAIYILGYVFSGAAEPACLDALDENDDGFVQIADAIYHFNALFLGGPLPAAPWDSCGVDPTDDTLECDSYQSCP
ncbi:MAG: HYR domain-containing protein [Planctomycetota bacterium]